MQLPGILCYFIFHVFTLLLFKASTSDAVTLTTSAQSGGDVCFGDVVQLTCTTRRDLTEYLASGRTYWTEDDNEDRLPNTPPYSFQLSNRSLLTVNFTREHFQERTTYFYQCHYIFRNTSLDESGVVGIVTGPVATEVLKLEGDYKCDVPPSHLARPFTPSLLGPVNITESAAVLSLSPHTGHKCFEDCSFHFDVTLTSTVLGSQATFTSNTSRVVLSGLRAAYSYRADITSVCSGRGGQLGSRSEPLVVELFVGPGTTESSTTDTGIAVIAGGSIGGVLVAVIIFIAGCASGVLSHVVYQKMATKKSKAPPSSPPAPSYGHTQGDVGAGPEMTDNPSYQLVERSQDSKQLYQNL